MYVQTSSFIRIIKAIGLGFLLSHFDFCFHYLQQKRTIKGWISNQYESHVDGRGSILALLVVSSTASNPEPGEESN
jgi:hypothetical protein